MSNKRMYADSFISGTGSQQHATGRPSSKGNDLNSSDSRDPHAGESPRASERRPSKTADGAESDANSDQAGRTRKKAEPVKSACVQCQKRKTKCSGQRPVCRFCSDRNLECSWDIGDGLTRTADLKRKLQEANGRSLDLDTLVGAMRNGTDEVSTMLLAKLRLGDSIEDLASQIRLDPSPGESCDSESPQNAERTGNTDNSVAASYPSMRSSTHQFEWTGPGSQLARANPNSNWTADSNQYQPLNAQSFFTPAFDQSRITWQRSGPRYPTEDNPMHNDAMQSPQPMERKDSGLPPQVQLIPRCLDAAPVPRRKKKKSIIVADT